MSGKVFVIADLHFGHLKLAKLRGFADSDQHDAFLIDAWNRTVDKRDVVYVLGDVMNPEKVRQLHGIKKLVMGNHDQKPVAHYNAFSRLCGSYEYDGCLLTHIPVHPSQFPRYRLNIHGHTHEHRLDDRRYVPTSVERCPDYAPMLLNRLIADADEALCPTF